ncbi:MAG: hypothetical protein HW393_664, partial [Dehalococcoidia bacterium]|nr:hypothetical protein [Dehalococcoidia bacterium]
MLDGVSIGFKIPKSSGLIFPTLE